MLKTVEQLMKLSYILKSVSLTLQKRDLHGFFSSWITDLLDWSWAFALTVTGWGPETAVVTIHL